LPGFIIVPLIHYFKDQRLIGFLIAITSVISFLALIYLPNLAYLWGFLIGLSNGGVLLLGLIYAGIKCSKPAQVAALAAMMQFIGYVIAAIAPPIFGSLKDFTGNWHITLWSFVVMSAIVTYFVYLSSGKQLIKQ